MIYSIYLQLLLACLFFFQRATCIDGGSDWYYQEAQSHPCQRPCLPGDVRTCYYRFSIEWYWAFSKACYDCPHTLSDCYRKDCVLAGGVERFITVVNRQMPGPSIEVCHGDKLEVEVENMMDDQTTSIHWHGHHQVKTPYMDGVPFITQCPISPNSVFRYTMQVTNPGTHFWHGHTGWQKSSGVFGPLVVRSAPSAEDSLLYDFDLSEHTIIINDWTRVTDMDKFQFFVQSNGNKSPEAIFVNGMGRYFNDSIPLTHTPLAVFTVQKGFRYRFRLINSGAHDCPVDLNIDGHPITAIASDGSDIEPVTVDSLVSYAGERWDFVLEATSPLNNYWMRFTGLQDCAEDFAKVHQVAVLHYKGVPEREPKDPVGYNIHSKAKLQLNPPNVALNQTGTLSVPALIASTRTQDPVLLHDPDMSVILSYDFNRAIHTMYAKHYLYGSNQVDPSFQPLTPQFNHVSFKMPHSPLLSQYSDVDPSIFCENHNLTDCNTTFCECLYVMEVPTNSNVELILIDIGEPFDANHPIHLHGYAFRVIGMDRLGESVDEELVRKLNREGRLVRNLENPPLKDTVTVPDGGYTIIRFHANNPGYWLFHCHIDFHMELGMNVVFKVGKDEEFPPVPDGFPKCGDYKNDNMKLNSYS
ncbi:laccase-1-like isoform X2 [Homalodisca vitripennis]|nr:laccase-1-like isoform X2 [Homalodisca vitripennis]